MSIQPIPMNRAERRRQGRAALTAETAVYSVKLIERRVYQRQDGATVAQSVFAPVAQNGQPLIEDDTPDGPMPVLLLAVPIVIKKPSGLIAAPALVKP